MEVLVCLPVGNYVKALSQFTWFLLYIISIIFPSAWQDGQTIVQFLDGNILILTDEVI